MDKETLSNYGWIVICVLVLAVMIALATPFGNFISDAIWSTANGLFSTNNNALDSTLEDLGVVPTPEQLQARYKFEYYSTLNGAVNDVNNGTIGTNADANKDDAVAGIYTNAGQTYVVLLKDTTEATRIQPSVDMTINLGGHTLSADNAVCIAVNGGNLTIDGRLAGSSIVMNRDGSSTACFFVSSSSVAESLTIKGGTYSTVTESNTAYAVNQISTTIKCAFWGCRMDARSNSGAAYGIVCWSNFEVSSCDINTASQSGLSQGISIPAGVTAKVSNCNIEAYSSYYSSGDNYTSYSQGVSNLGTLTINDCYVLGTHSGLQNHGTLYVNGGTFESYGHGGIYFSGEGTTAYVRNATLNDVLTMPEGWEGTSQHNGAGFYIGGYAGRDNISVYMDNCKIYGSANQIVLRGSSGEKNNTLYISNSNIYDLDGNTLSVRIDNDTHKLYLGTGNNFTADNTTRPSAVIATTETYIQK